MEASAVSFQSTPPAKHRARRHHTLSTQDLLDRAQRAVESAKLLPDAGDVNGACNRAYYAMFDAARAALIATQKPPESEEIKTHSGLISAFSLHLVKTGHVSVELGKSFSKVADIRLVADYSDEEVSPDRAEWAIEQAAAFVGAMRQRAASSA
jgi:uncharacterized protein (UPF0332 family)